MVTIIIQIFLLYETASRPDLEWIISCYRIGWRRYASGSELQCTRNVRVAVMNGLMSLYFPIIFTHADGS